MSEHEGEPVSSSKGSAFVIQQLAAMFGSREPDNPFLVPTLSNGERALIRRMIRPDRADMKVVQCLTEAKADDNEFSAVRFQRWRVLMQAMALIAGTDRAAKPHDGARARKIGEAMADVLALSQGAKAAERDIRFLNLMEADGPAFEALLVRMIRRLAAGGISQLDFVELWRLLGSAPGDRTRMKVARDFYGAKNFDPTPGSM